jgi:hypothetical protein
MENQQSKAGAKASRHGTARNHGLCLPLARMREVNGPRLAAA